MIKMIMFVLFLGTSVGIYSNRQPFKINRNPAGVNLQVQKPINDGSVIYQKYCLSCHQTDGNGVPGMYPPLKASDWVKGDKSKLIKAALNGLSGEITVNGKHYNQTMPPLTYLTDKQIADVLTYVRSTFGNASTSVSVTEVKTLRNAK